VSFCEHSMSMLDQFEGELKMSVSGNVLQLSSQGTLTKGEGLVQLTSSLK
jgi:hypothetical protein